MKVVAPDYEAMQRFADGLLTQANGRAAIISGSSRTLRIAAEMIENQMDIIHHQHRLICDLAEDMEG
jgi:hypothetical protein